MMKREVMIKAWVDALRSGEYSQATGSMRWIDKSGEPKHCCLGVMCEIYKEKTGFGSWSEEEGSKSTFRSKSGMRAGVPPSDVTQMFLPQSVRPQMLAKLNDRDAMSFDEIADWIEDRILSPTDTEVV